MRPKEQRNRLVAYVAGFVLSVVLTLCAFAIVAEKNVSGWALTLILLSFAVVQLMVQLLFFLHMDSESKPRLNLQVFLFMALVLVIIVAGSLWIMDNLAYHSSHEEPEELEQFLLEEEGLE